MSRGMPLSGVAINSCRTSWAASIRASNLEMSAPFAGATQTIVIPTNEAANMFFIRFSTFRAEALHSSLSLRWLLRCDLSHNVGSIVRFLCSNLEHSQTKSGRYAKNTFTSGYDLASSQVRKHGTTGNHKVRAGCGVCHRPPADCGFRQAD